MPEGGIKGQYYSRPSEQDPVRYSEEANSKNGNLSFGGDKLE